MALVVPPAEDVHLERRAARPGAGRSTRLALPSISGTKRYPKGRDSASRRSEGRAVVEQEAALRVAHGGIAGGNRFGQGDVEEGPVRGAATYDVASDVTAPYISV